jgi:O-antigen ligase
MRLKEAVDGNLPWIAGVLVGAGGFVRIEPAPYDIGIVLLMGVTAAVRLWRFPWEARVAYLGAGIFVLSHIFPPVNGSVDSLYRYWRFTGITLYLLATWVFFVAYIGRYGDGGRRAVWSGYFIGAVTSSALGVLGAVGLFGLRDLFTYGGYRAMAWFKDPNVFAAFLVGPCIYGMDRCLVARRITFALWLCGFVLVQLGLVLALSRAAWLGALVAFVVYGVLRCTFRPHPIWADIGKAVLVALCSVVIDALAIHFLNVPVGARASLQPYDADRFGTWERTISLGIQHFFLGIGPGQSELRLAYATHNTFLRVFLENGVFGLVGFGMFLAACVANLIRRIMTPGGSYASRDLDVVLMCALVGVLVNSIFIDALHWRHFWFLAAMAAMPVKSLGGHTGGPSPGVATERI